jgi:hypothetical protein
MAATVLLATALISSPAEADPYPDVVYPDKGTYHTFCFTSAFANLPALVSRARYSMDNNDGLEAQTVVNTQEQACGALTDVRFVADGVPGYLGYTDCLELNVNYYCDTWRVRINWPLIQSDGGTATVDGYIARLTLCHEIGHTVAVRHYASTGQSPDYPKNSCMISGPYGSGAAWTRQYGSHHRGHINAWFS